MQHVKKGNLIAIEDNDEFFYFLVLSGAAFFGCQWAYCFHHTSRDLSSEADILGGFGEGFHALVDFIEHRREKAIIKISTIVDTKRYEVKSNLKCRIDQFEAKSLWYIYDTNFNILTKQEFLKSKQRNFPIASGVDSENAIKLIRSSWTLDDIVIEEGKGQFPV